MGTGLGTFQSVLVISLKTLTGKEEVIYNLSLWCWMYHVFQLFSTSPQSQNLTYFLKMNILKAIKKQQLKQQPS